MQPSHSVTRRQFTKSAVLACVAAPTILTRRRAFGAGREANDRIQLGFIGMGRKGIDHLRRFSKSPEVQVMAVCDVNAERLAYSRDQIQTEYAAGTSRGAYRGCGAYNDFREMLDRGDLDAVVISTPDHWHAPTAAAAARLGLDIYCEKPLTHCIAHGRALVNAIRENNVIFQTGSQQRSEYDGKFRYAAELIRNGRIGEVKTVRIGVGEPAVACDLPTEPTPDGTDWNLWLGSAPWRGYNEILCPKGIHKHFPAWRKYREYAGGGLADMGAHHFDIAQWALDMDTSGPVRIDPPAGDATTGLKYTYANGIEMFHGGPSGCTFEGIRGTIYVDRGKMESTPAEVIEQPISTGDVQLYRADSHFGNCIACIRSRDLPLCDVETGHRSATVCNLGNIGYWLRRTLHWDPATERFANDDEANALVDREMRSPWTI